MCGFEAQILKAVLSLLFSLRSGLSSLMAIQPEAPRLVSPLGGDHGKGILTAAAELSYFFPVWLGALCHFFHERYQRNFYIWASPSSMKNPASCPHTASSTGALASGGSALSGREVYRETTRVLPLFWLCVHHISEEQSGVFNLCCFFFFPLLYSLPAWKWRVCFFRKPFLKYEVTTCDFPDGPGKSEFPMQGPRVQSQLMELRSCVLHRAARKKQKHDTDGQEA